MIANLKKYNMQYHNGTSEASLLAADSVTLLIRNGRDVWISGCQVIKRDGQMIALASTTTSSPQEFPISDTAIVNQSLDQSFIVMMIRDEK